MNHDPVIAWAEPLQRRAWPRSTLVMLAVGLAIGLTACSSGGLLDPGNNLAPGSGIFGRVITDDAQPVAGAVVVVQDAQNTVLGQPATTAADGSFRIDLPDGELPEGLRLEIRPRGGNVAQAPVDVPRGARVEVEVRLRPDGGATVRPLLAPPTTALALDDEDHGPWLVPVNTQGRSAPFRVARAGQFGGQAVEVRLIDRRHNGPWRVSAPGRAQGEQVLATLDLADRLAAVHGQRREVRALVAAAGLLAGVTELRNLGSLRHGVIVGPERLVVVPVTTRADRLGPGQVRPNAVLVAQDDDFLPDGVARLAADDLAQLGFSDGDRVRLTRDRREVTLRLQASTDPLLRLATLLLSERDANRLQLELREQLAGYTLAVTAADASR